LKPYAPKYAASERRCVVWEEDKAALEQRLAFLAQELAYTRPKVPPGARTS
jgi:hypothetical protein